MLPKLRIATIGLIAAAAIITTSCSPSRGTDQAQSQGSKTSSSDNSLTLQGPQDAVYPGEQAYVQGFGGTPPYSYYIVSGSGSIEADTGLFSADLSQGTVQIGVKDSAGKTATTTLSVGAGWGSSVLLKTDYPTITVTQKVTLSATGGSAPYYFAVASGTGSVSGNVYTAPATTGTVTLIVVDSVGGTNSKTFTIQSVQALTLNTVSKSMAAGSQYTFVASGGVPPYTWSIPFGGGTISKGKYTASLIAGPARVQAKDAQGSVVYADITITPTYSTSHQSASFPLTVDHYLAFTYDNSAPEDRDHPSFVFFGSGPNADATDPAKNCTITSQCIYTVSLNNFSNSNFAYATYRGTIGMAGRTGGAQLTFCIDPADTSRAKVRWESGVTGFTKQVQYSLSNKTLFNGAPIDSAYTPVDTASGAGSATVNFDGAYTADIDCSDFAGASEVVVNP